MNDLEDRIKLGDFVKYMVKLCLVVKWSLALSCAGISALIHWQFSSSVIDTLACALFFGLLSLLLWSEKVELALIPGLLKKFSQIFPVNSAGRELAIDRLVNMDFEKNSFQLRFCLELPGYHYVSVSRKKNEYSIQKSSEASESLDDIKQRPKEFQPLLSPFPDKRGGIEDE